MYSHSPLDIVRNHSQSRFIWHTGELGFYVGHMEVAHKACNFCLLSCYVVSGLVHSKTYLSCSLRAIYMAQPVYLPVSVAHDTVVFGSIMNCVVLHFC